MKISNPIHAAPAARSGGLGFLALCVLISGAASPTAVAASQDENDLQIATCRIWMTAVRQALFSEPSLRDEAYTAIMWARLDAEAAYAERDAAACLAALEFPRRALGLPLGSEGDAGAPGASSATGTLE